MTEMDARTVVHALDMGDVKIQDNGVRSVASFSIKLIIGYVLDKGVVVMIQAATDGLLEEIS